MAKADKYFRHVKRFLEYDTAMMEAELRRFLTFHSVFQDFCATMQSIFLIVRPSLAAWNGRAHLRYLVLCLAPRQPMLLSLIIVMAVIVFGILLIQAPTAAAPELVPYCNSGFPRHRCDVYVVVCALQSVVL